MMPSTTDLLLLRASHSSICDFLLPESRRFKTDEEHRAVAPHIRIVPPTFSPPSLAPRRRSSLGRDPTDRPSAMGSSNVFTDTEFCLACEKALKGGNSYYCDDVCRAQEAAEKVSGDRYGFHKPGDSPLILASLPPLIASQVHAQAMARQRSQGASASNSSLSETSSPLQSPSPLAGQPITTIEGSPREDMFLPPPAFQNPHHYMAATNPVKVPVPYQASLPGSYAARQSSYQAEGATMVNDSTLHYGRRPAQTNSITSPLALYPVGNTRRRESQGTVNKPKAGTASPSLGTKPTSRVVSDTHANRDPHPRTGFAYGMHSPLVLATNRRPSPPTMIIDFTQARPTYSTGSSTVHAAERENLETYRPTSRDVYGYAGISQLRLSTRLNTSGNDTITPSPTSAVSERRKSFPAHLMGQQRPIIAKETRNSRPTERSIEIENSPPRRGRSRQRAEGAVDREPSRHASRSSRGSDGSSRRREDRTSSRVARSGSRRRFSDDADHTVGPRLGARTEYMPSPPRVQHAVLPSSSIKVIGQQPSASRAIGTSENTRNTFLGRDLSTIMASFNQPGAVQPRFGLQDEEDNISEEAEDAEDGRSRGRGGRRSPKRGSPNAKNGRGRRGLEDSRDLADKESQAARELKRLFDEGVSISGAA